MFHPLEPGNCHARYPGSVVLSMWLLSYASGRQTVAVGKAGSRIVGWLGPRLTRFLGGGDPTLPPDPNELVLVEASPTWVPEEHILQMAGIACVSRFVPSVDVRSPWNRGRDRPFVARRDLELAQAALAEFTGPAR
jgi:hypothetical protein